MTSRLSEVGGLPAAGRVAFAADTVGVASGKAEGARAARVVPQRDSHLTSVYRKTWKLHA